jgi:transposase-like protein
MSEPRLDRVVRHRLAVLRHAEEVTGNVAMTCRYYGITRQSFYTWKRRDEADGPEGAAAALGHAPRAARTRLEDAARRIAAAPLVVPLRGVDY